MGNGVLSGEKHLLTGNHILYRAHTLCQLVLAQKDDEGHFKLVGIGHFLLKFFLLAVKLDANATAAEAFCQGNGRSNVLSHRQDQHIRRSGGQLGVKKTLLVQHIEQSGQTDGNTNAGQRTVGVVAGQVVVTTTGADGADLRMIQQCGLVNRAGVVIQTAGNGQIHSEIAFRNTEGGEVLGNGLQFIKTLIKQLIFATVAFQCCQHLFVGATDGDEAKNGICLFFGNGKVDSQNLADILGSDFF